MVIKSIPIIEPLAGQSSVKVGQINIDGSLTAPSSIVPLGQAVQTTNVAIGNTTTETSIFTGTIIGTKTLKANTDSIDPRMVTGAWFNFQIPFDLTTKAATPGTITFRIRLGGVSGTLILSSGALTLLANLAVSGKINGSFLFQTQGASGSMGGLIEIISNGIIIGTSPYQIYKAYGVAVDTTSDQAIEVTVQFGTADATNSFTFNPCIIKPEN